MTKVEKSIEYLEDTIQQSDDIMGECSTALQAELMEQKRHYETAIAALREQMERSANEPLSLDELRRMDGKPVWIVEHPYWGHWELSEDAEDYIEDRDPDFYGMRYNDPDGRYGLHVLGWLAYRRPPTEK